MVRDEFESQSGQQKGDAPVNRRLGAYLYRQAQVPEHADETWKYDGSGVGRAGGQRSGTQKPQR